jgi:hydrogenase nickel incorporation protein HypB
MKASQIREKVVLRQRILQENEEAAARLREGFRAKGTLVVNLISSPGSGKTTLLEATVRVLKAHHGVGVLVGDIATERDADRLRKLGVPALQILTGGACHLDARQIDAAARDARFPDLDYLFIENVGNLICPTSFDLGEDFKVALLSVTEGDDKPFKYPGIFSRASATLITKMDLLPHVMFDLEAVRRQVLTLNADARILEVSAVRGDGLEPWLSWLEERRSAKLCPATA